MSIEHVVVDSCNRSINQAIKSWETNPRWFAIANSKRKFPCEVQRLGDCISHEDVMGLACQCLFTKPKRPVYSILKMLPRYAIVYNDLICMLLNYLFLLLIHIWRFREWQVNLSDLHFAPWECVVAVNMSGSVPGSVELCLCSLFWLPQLMPYGSWFSDDTNMAFTEIYPWNQDRSDLSYYNFLKDDAKKKLNLHTLQMKIVKSSLFYIM